MKTRTYYRTRAFAVLALIAMLAVSVVRIAAPAEAQPVQIPPQDYVEQAFHDAFLAVGEADWAVRMVRCEGWNSTANFDLTFISVSSDVGPAQINQIHGRTGGVIEGQWPGYVQTLAGNIEVALILYGDSGRQPWANSAHCHSSVSRSNAKVPNAKVPNAVQAPTTAPVPTTQPVAEATRLPAPVAVSPTTPPAATPSPTQIPTIIHRAFTG